MKFPFKILYYFSVVLFLSNCGENVAVYEWQEEKVQQGNFTVKISDAELDALTKTIATASTMGKIAWLVEEGSEVKKGDLLAELEKEELEEKLEHVSEDLKTAQEHLEELENSFADEKKELTATLEKFSTNLQIAKLRLERLQTGPTDIEKKEQKALVDQKQVVMEDANGKWKRSVKGDIVTAQIQKELAVEKDIAALDYQIQTVNYEKFLLGGTDLEKEKAKLDVSLAQNDFEIAQKNWNLQVSNLEGEIKLARISVERSKQEQELIQKQLERHNVYASADGVVIYRKLRGKEKIAVGMDVWAGAGTIEIPDLTKMKVNFRIRESIIGSIKIGTPVTIHVDTIADQEYQGKIIWIARHSQDQNEHLVAVARREQGPSGIRVFEVQAQLIVRDERLRPGLKAKVTIPLKNFTNVLLLSRSAIQFDKKPFVYRLDKGKKVRQNLQLGEYDQQRVIVVSGLKAGESVYYPIVSKE